MDWRPGGTSGDVISVSNVVIQSAINHFGSACIAGNSAALNFEYISFLLSTASHRPS